MGRSVTSLVTLWSLACLGGCGKGMEKWLPDRASLGAGVREGEGHYLLLKRHVVAPVVTLRGIKEINRKIEAYGELQLLRAQVSAESRGPLTGYAIGQFASVGVGVDWFPDPPWPDFPKRAVGLELGGEVFSASYDIYGQVGRTIKFKVPDELTGASINLSVIGEIPLGKEAEKRGVCLRWKAGYNFTTTHADQASVDLNGFSAGLSLDFPLD